MDLSNWKEIIIGVLSGGAARDLGGRLWRTLSKEGELIHETEITKKMFERAAELESKLLVRINTLEEALLKSEIACRMEINNIRQEYEVRIGELRHRHATEVTNLQVDLGKTQERCTLLEREISELRRAGRGHMQ